MPRLPVLDREAKKALAIQVALCVLVFVLGVLIGYFPDRKFNRNRRCTLGRAVRNTCTYSKYGYTWRKYIGNYFNTHTVKVCIPKDTACNDYDLPRNYIAYHRNGRSITIDGNLDDEAWADTQWSEYFVDMRSINYPAPRLATLMKMVWDNTNLYIGIYAKEKDLWAVQRDRDSPVFRDNAVEFLLDTDGDMHSYIQLQVNVLGTLNDQMITKSVWDGGFKFKNFSSQARHAVYYQGTINKAGDEDEYWSVEFAIPFTSLAENSTKTSPMPAVDETWFMQFGRSEWKLTALSNNTYTKTPGEDPDWWSWQPCGAINLHLQDRWGLVQFKRNPRSKKFNFRLWHMYKALFDAMSALKRYQAVNGRYIDRVRELDFPPHLMSGRCVDIPTVKLVKRNGTADFEVTVKSLIINHPPGHIRSDRYVWFQ